MTVVSWLNTMRRRLGHDDGAVMPLVAIMIFMLLGFVALGVDWGRSHEERRYLQNASDAAALAGSRELPENPAAAEAVAREYLRLNGLSADEAAAADVDIYETFVAYDTIRVTTNRTLTNLFAGVIGVPQTDVPATAIAISGSSVGDCPLPLAVVVPEGTTTWPWPFYDGTGLPPDWPLDPSSPYLITLKTNPDGQAAGNFGGYDIYKDQYDGRQGFNNIFDALAGKCPDGVEAVPYEDYPEHTGGWGNAFVKAISQRVCIDGCSNLSHPLGEYAWYDGEYWQPKDGKTWAEQSGRFVYMPVVWAPWPPPRHQATLQGYTMFFVTFLGTRTYNKKTETWNAPQPCTGPGQCPPGDMYMQGIYIRVNDPTGWTAWNPYGTRVQRLWR